ncbi:hypothetical protein [Halioxenophilus aromaticivorans]|uniref:Apea-like HEPN domain-containing protein n=1 Tax=Halioxenophilus aromaticivorans TaxID=1306992 RepID=A0AAV3U8W3_9ALTE
MEDHKAKYKFTSASDHAYNLKCCIQFGCFEGQYFEFAGVDTQGVLEVLSWLELSADISDVEISPRYSNSVQWCSGAYEYEKLHKSHYKKFAFKISRLVFVWSAFEQLCETIGIDSIVPGNEGPGVKVGKFLQQKDITVHPSFIEMWRHLSDLYLKHEDFGKKKIKIYPFAESWDVASLINLARDVRNKAAHGGSSLRSPEDYSFGGELPSKCYLCFIDAAVRAVLLTMQMLLSTFLSKKVGEYYCSYSGEGRALDMSQYLNTLHLAQTEHPDIMHW